RTERIGATPVKGASLAFIERFGQHKIPEDKVQHTESCGGIEWRAQPPVGQQTAECRPQDKPEPERRANQPEVFRAVGLVRTDVGNVRRASREAGAGATGNDPADKQPAVRRRPGENDVAETEAEQRRQQDGAPAEAVAEVTDNGRKDELRHRKYR